ncbi:esterase-like activity of phytase family protein [Pararhodobacter aggregans]|uniref:Alkaline phosphatase n=1 Tax=Pararhodobacter aggregans TaxID=404875 RepID=A0A2T7UL66_9RHOB|nr:esterase-like activity of phytase family protein [Pararhodobacter aggregans]PTX05374.1 phytase-like protein with esterase activity [Pararhodobacter aggregans]PVE45381.1 alkaline phosphatase [Pararhodobacter aggregans]
MPTRLLASSALALILATPGFAQEMNFNRIAAFPVARNLPEAEETSAEIIAATEDGLTLVYTDSPSGSVGFIDITDPAAPAPLGALDVAGEPTSVAIAGTTGYVAVNTSADYVTTGGALLTLDVAGRAITASCDLGGQPDSVAIAPDQSFLAVAIENERDEELNDGALPQMPAGYVAILPLTDGTVDCAAMIRAEVTGLADIAPEDPEPEFVSINAAGEIALTLQENNHIVILDRTGAVLSHFSAGEATAENVDTVKDGQLVFDQSVTRLREPDAITWVDAGHVAIANEGDWNGGSRTWSVFNRDGTLVYDSGSSLEHAIVEIGHYPEGRSGKKGVELESVTAATFGETPMIFVGSERGSVIGVYDATDPAAPVLRQLLPSGIGPEGLLAIPSRGLFVTANESDLGADGAARSHVMVYEWQEAPAAYPQLTSAGMDQLTGWGAISGMVAGEDGMLYAISDSVYGAQPTIFVIDPSQQPARIVQAIRVTRDGAPAAHMDMEGITLDGQGGFWVANEGRTDREIPHALYHVDASGAITEEVTLPDALLAQERRFGFEGVTMVDGTLWMAVQREWGDDPEGMVKLLAYTPATGDWAAVHYPLAAHERGWVGLSEIVAHEGYLYIVERDNQLGDLAAIKQITRVALADLQPAPLGGALPVVTPEVVVDLLPYLTATGGYVLDKVESLAITADGTMWIATDNDGVDDHSGETMFFALPPM